MATVILDLAGTLPQTFPEGLWPRTHFNTGKYRFTWTPTAANTNAAWGTDFYAVLASSGQPSGSDTGGIYILSDAIEIYNQTAQLISRSITWGAGATITLTINMAIGQLIIDGATTGNGTYSFTVSGVVFTAGTLGVGIFGGGGFNLPASTFSDIDNGEDGVVGTSTTTLAALTQSSSGLIPVVGVSASTLGTLTQSATSSQNQNGTSNSTLGILTQVAQGVSSRFGVSSSTLGALTQIASNLDTVSLGVFGASRVLFPTPAGFVTETLNTQVSGSTFLVVCAGNVGDLADAPTDNKGNTYIDVISQDYNDWPGYGMKAWVCENGVGGSSHTFSQEYGQTIGFDEMTIAVVEVKNGTHLQAIAVNHPNNGQALTSPSVTSTAPAVWIGFWSGDAPTGQTATISWNNGFQTLDETTLVDHPNGYVPVAIGAIPTTDYTPTTRNFTVTESPDQGSINIIAVVQASEGRLSLSTSTLGTLTQSAAGEVKSAGVSTSTLGTLTQSSTGRVAISGVSVSTLGVLTSQGSLFISGVSNSTLAALTCIATSATPIQGVSTSTLEALTCQAIISPERIGSLDITLGSLVCVAHITTDLTGQAIMSLSELSLTAGGGHTRLIKMAIAGDVNLRDQVPNITLVEG